MGTSNNWLKKRKKRERLIARIQNIVIGSLIAAVAIGPLIYFGVVAVPLELREARQAEQRTLRERPATPEIITEISATPEIEISQEPLQFPEEKKEKKEIVNPKVEFTPSDLADKKERIKEEVQTSVVEAAEPKLIETLKTEFRDEDKDVKIRKTKIQFNGQEETLLVMENLDINDGPRQVRDTKNADIVARAALRRYLKTNPKEANFDIYTDTGKLNKSKKQFQLVVSDIKTNNNKWYITFQQFKEGLPVFDGNVKMIFTERKKLLTITDNIRLEFAEDERFQLNENSASESAKTLFDWDNELDKIKFVNRGYYKNKEAFKVEVESHNPLGEYEIFVDAKNANIEDVKGDIRLANGERLDPATGLPDPVDENILEPHEEDASWTPPENFDMEAYQKRREQEAPADNPTNFLERKNLNRSEIFEKIIAPVRREQTVMENEIEITSVSEELLSDEPATPDLAATPDIAATFEPDILIVDTIYSQILGKIFPQNPNQQAQIEPLSYAYTYYNNKQSITDEEGYFENKDLDWYSTFLEGPYVVVYDDDASADVEIKDRTPEDPFVWDENSTSLATINAFYHTNKMHKYFADEHNLDLNKQIPVTVNSELVDQYLNGCGAWFNNSVKEIEMGRGGTQACPEDLNYALSSDFVYHEYAHFIVEEITHLPNVTGSEAAAMGEGLADYFAATINNDSVWGDVVAPNDTRNLKNNLNYQTNMTGEAHNDGQIFAGALWDLRILIGPDKTDELVFNTLYQDRLHFETFMYGMLIEDDDNNDFSDGTPHMLEIIAAFENHGIGPGIENFDGLPVDPDAWSELLYEEEPEGPEDPILNALNSGCSSYDDGSYINIDANVTCYWTGTGSRTGVTISNGGTLYIGTSSASGVLDVSGDVVVNGSNAASRLYIGHYSYYADLDCDELKIINGAYVYVGYGGHSSTNIDVNSVQVYETGTGYTSNNFLAVYNQGNIYGWNVAREIYIGRSDTYAGYYGDDSYIYISGDGSLSNGGGSGGIWADNDGYIRNHGLILVDRDSSIRDNSFVHNYDSGTFDMNGNTMYVYNNGYIENEGIVRDGNYTFNHTTEFQQDDGDAIGTTYTFEESAVLDHNGGTTSPDTVTFQVGAGGTSSLDLDGGTFDPTNANFNNSTYADVNNTGDFSPNTATFTGSADLYHNGGQTNSATINLNGDNRWHHRGGTTSITNFNIAGTSIVNSCTNGETLTAGNFNLSGSGILEKFWYDSTDNGNGDISANTITAEDTSTVRFKTNTGTVNVSNYVTIDDDSTYNQKNDNTVNITNDMYVRGTVQSAQSGEIFMEGGTLNIDGTLRIYENAFVKLDGGTIDVNTLHMNSDEAYLDNNGGTVDCEGLEMYQNSEIENDATFIIRSSGARMNDTSVFTNDYTSGGTATVTMSANSMQQFFMDESSDFYNNAGGTFNAQTDATNGDTLDLTDSSLFENYGTVNIYNMRIGWNETDQTEYGGWYYNKYTTSEGITNINNDLTIYRGDMINEAGSTTSYGVFVSGDVYMTSYWSGSACDDADIQNSGFFDITGNVTMTQSLSSPGYSCSRIDNDGSSSTVSRFSVNNIDADYAEVDISNAGSGNASLFEVRGSWDMNTTYSYIDNLSNGTITVYDDLLLTSNSDNAVWLRNYGDIDISGSSSEKLHVLGKSTAYNYSGGSITVQTSFPSSDVRGVLYVYTEAEFTNEGVLDTNRLFIGNGSTSGGTFINKTGGDTSVTYNDTGYAMICYRAICSHYNDATNFDIAGDVQIEGVSGDTTIFSSNYNASARSVDIFNYGQLDVRQSSTFTTTGTSYIYDDQQSPPGNDGGLYVRSGSTFDATGGTLNLGWATSTATGGNVYNDGTVKVNNLYMYESSIFDNNDTGALYSYNLVELADTFTANDYIRDFNNDGYVQALDINVFGDNAYMENQATTGAQFYIQGDLDITGGDFTNQNGNTGVVVDGTTYVQYESGTVTNGELYNYDTFTTNKLYVSGYAQNGQGTTDATMTVNSSTGTDDMVVTRIASSAPSSGTYLNSFGKTDVAGQIHVHGLEHVDLDAYLINSTNDPMGYAQELIADEIYIEKIAYLKNHGDMDVGNKLWTADNTFYKYINNYDTGNITVSGTGDLWLYNQTTLQNDYHTDSDKGRINSTNFKVFTNGGTTTVNNYGIINTVNLWNGYIAEQFGGTINNEANGVIDVTGTSADAGKIYVGTINIKENATTFDVAGTFSMRGTSTASEQALFDTEWGDTDTHPTMTFGTLGLSENSLFESCDDVEIDNSYGQTGNLTIQGSTSQEARFRQRICGSVGVGETSKLTTDGTTTVGSYGVLEIDSNDRTLGGDYTNGGFQAIGPVEVNYLGTLTSDSSSTFNFQNESGLTNDGGTVELFDDVKATIITQADTTYGQYASIQIGQETNVGKTWITGKLDINAGTFTSYNHGDNVDEGSYTDGYQDIEISGSGTTAYFANDDGSSSLACQTDIAGYLDILNGATVYIDCETSPAVNVHSNSPGGTTLVEGTLYINTNLTTENMIVGSDSATGLVTHDYVCSSSPCITNGASQVFDLDVSKDLKINSNSSIDVSAKSKYLTSGTMASGESFGGTYGGKGQLSTTSGVAEYGQVTSPLDNTDYLNFHADFGVGGIVANAGSPTTPELNSFGGGKAKIYVSGTLDIDSNGAIKANGETTSGNTSGSGGSLVIFATRLIGGGDIQADGGDNTAGAQAGGGGRVYMDYMDKDSYNGDISTYGGHDGSGDYAANGTVFYRSRSTWLNQKKGSLVISGGSNSSADIDKDGTSNEVDATNMPPTGTGGPEGNANQDEFDVESIQVIKNASFEAEDSPLSETRQCIEDTTGTVFFPLAGSSFNYNNDHGGLNYDDCLYTPDPAHTLYINDSIIGSGSGQESDNNYYDLDYGSQTANFTVGSTLYGDSGTAIIIADTDNGTDGTLQIDILQGGFSNGNTLTGYNGGAATASGDAAFSTVATVYDINPEASSVHNDAELENDPGGDRDTDSATQFQLQIANSLDDLYLDNTGSLVCNVDTQSISPLLPDDERHPGYVVDDSLCTLAGNNTYYWRMRYKDTGDTHDGWGLWSKSGQFDVGEGGTLVLDTCHGTQSDKFDIGTYDSSQGNNYDSDYCDFDTEATVAMDIATNKNQKLTHSTNSDVSIWDMTSTDFDPVDSLGGMDGETDTADDYDNEVGFHLLDSSVDTGVFSVAPSNAGPLYTANYTYLPNSPATLLESSAGYSNQSFTMYLGAFIHGLIPHETDPINNPPTGTCGYTDGGGTETHDTCTSLSGTYTATVTVSATTSP